MATSQTEIEPRTEVISPERHSVQWPPAPSKKLALFALVGLFTVFAASVIFKPATVDPNGEYFTICGFKNLTGLPCPACGLTHSFCALGKGDLVNAFAFNLLGPMLFLALLLLWIRAALVLSNETGRVWIIDRWSSRVNVVKSIVIAFFVYGAARIAWLIVIRPPGVVNSPLMRAISRLFG